MNEMTLQQLGYYKVKERVMEYTISFKGRRHVENMQPMTRLTLVRNALNDASEALAIINNGASLPIPSLEGMETILQLSGTGYVYSEQDFSNLQMFLRSCKQLKTYMAAKASLGPRISTYAASMYELTDLKNEIERCIRNGRIMDSAGDGSMFSVFTNIAVDIGDGQSIEQSLSTFSAHIRNVVDILKELYRREAKVVVTTHFNEIKEFARTNSGFENARMEFDADTLQPLYRLRIGEAGQSYALFIALKLGLSSDIIRRSNEIASGRKEKQSCVEPKEAAPPSKSESNVKKGKKQETPINDEANGINPNQKKRFEIGESVYVSYLRKTGIVYEEEDAKGNVGVLIQKQKLKINKKRLKLHIDKKDLYPDNYDFDIVFESKENRKKRKLMNRKYVEGLTIITNPEKQDGWS